MTTAGICTIGDEILSGKVTDINSPAIARELEKIGVRVMEMRSVGDERDEIYTTVTEMLSANDILIMTGGLGPTKDDVTKGVIYDLSESGKYVINQSQLDIIHEILSSRGLDVLEINRLQTSVPENCKVIPNRLGTAPIMSVKFPVEKFGHPALLYSLPGVPYEAAGAMEDVIADIRTHFPLSKIRHKTIMTYGIAESALAEKISGWESSLPASSHLAYLPDPLKGVALRLSIYSSAEAAEPDTFFEEKTAELRAILGPAIYAEEEKSLQEVIGETLRSRGKTLSTAESCTGGLIASLITSVPGASDYFLGSVVSYSNSVKTGVLGVPAEIIETHGAVSLECVAAMAEGVRKLTGSDYSVATSGIAGPGGGSPEKPVGMVCIGVATPNGTQAQIFNYHNDRQRNIQRFASTALSFLRLHL